VLSFTHRVLLRDLDSSRFRFLRDPTSSRSHVTSVWLRIGSAGDLAYLPESAKVSMGLKSPRVVEFQGHAGQARTPTTRYPDRISQAVAMLYGLHLQGSFTGRNKRST
jgi:hypothetical protein